MFYMTQCVGRGLRSLRLRARSPVQAMLFYILYRKLLFYTNNRPIFENFESSVQKFSRYPLINTQNRQVAG